MLSAFSGLLILGLVDWIVLLVLFFGLGVLGWFCGFVLGWWVCLCLCLGLVGFGCGVSSSGELGLCL